MAAGLTAPDPFSAPSLLVLKASFLALSDVKEWKER